LFRDAVRAALLGAGALSDALDVAFKIPNMLRDLFAEGAFSGAFVPTLSAVREKDGDEAAFGVLNRVLSTMLVHVGAVVAAIIWFAPDLVRLITSPVFATSATFDLTVILVRMLAPFLFFISLAVAAMGALNVFDRFFVPALSPALQNLVLVAGGGVMVALGVQQAQAAVPWAVLLLAGGMLQFAVQLPPLWRLGWRPRLAPDIFGKRPETRAVLGRMLPVVGGMAATHASIIINTKLATEHVGGTSNLYYGFRLVHLPVGLVGVAVGTAVLAEASRSFARRDVEAVREALAQATLLTLAFALPAAAGLAAIGGPIASMLFDWGNATPEQVLGIGETIQCFSVAVVFYCLVKVTVPVFYAQGRMRGPLIASLAAVACNVAVALALHPTMKWRGLALAIGAGQAVNWLVLMLMLRDEFSGSGRRILGQGLRLAVAAAACGAAAWGTVALLPVGDAAWLRVLRGLLPVLTGGIAYFGTAWVCGAREVLALLDSSRKRAYTS
jgi:putative peptidoglycan lipid II flippase